MQAASAAPAARGINRRCHCVGGTDTLGQSTQYDITGQEHALGRHTGAANSYAAQQHFADGRQIKVHDSRGSRFEPQTSYVDHYPPKVCETQADMEHNCCLHMLSGFGLLQLLTKAAEA